MAEATSPQLVPVAIEDEMRQAYLDYSMSVIVGRALPDVRDGLKPVHRRILYAMFDQGMLHNKRYSKAAGTVGEVLKKYHPHGDASVYDALVRLAPEWNLRHPLVDGQGNFGSIDGDSAAAYRYTEARLTRLAEMMLADIDKDTVDFGPKLGGTLPGGIQGPDFPTGGILMGVSPIRALYETGRGILRMRAKVEVETDKRTERERIVVTEVPYQVN